MMSTFDKYSIKFLESFLRRKSSIVDEGLWGPLLFSFRCLYFSLTFTDSSPILLACPFSLSYALSIFLIILIGSKNSLIYAMTRFYYRYMHSNINNDSLNKTGVDSLCSLLTRICKIKCAVCQQELIGSWILCRNNNRPCDISFFTTYIYGGTYMFQRAQKDAGVNGQLSSNTSDFRIHRKTSWQIAYCSRTLYSKSFNSVRERETVKKVVKG